MSTCVQQLGQKQRHPDRKHGEKEREGRAAREGVFGYMLLPAEPLKKIFLEQKQINSGFWLSLYTETTH